MSGVRFPGPRSGIALAALAAVTIVAVKAAEVTWHLTGETGENRPMTYPNQTGTEMNRPDLGPILALSPFGTAVRDDVVSTAQETSLGLTLKGVVAASPQNRSMAMIGQGGSVEQYIVGDRVPGGASLSEVHTDHVILTVAGRRERLSFPEGLETARNSGVEAMRARLAPSARQRSSAPSASAGTAYSAAAAAAGRSVAQSADTSLSADQVIDSYRQQIAANPQSVLDNLGAEATEKGYRLGDDMSPYLRRAGLQPGDVVVSVNGSSVGDVEQDRQLFEKVVASGQARVEIEREGRRMRLSFPLQ